MAGMYLTSLIHREILFEMVCRWFCNRLHPDDGLILTQSLICDGYVLGETLDSATRLLLEFLHAPPFAMKPIRFKGELRDLLCDDRRGETARVKELIQSYREDPEFYYRMAPVNGMACLDGRGRLLGLYRIKRPRRIAEKANRYVASWIFKTVQDKARELAEERAKNIGIPLKYLLTPETEMAREFIEAEKMIAEAFRRGEILLDKTAMTINDVGGIKIVADEDQLSRLEERLSRHPLLKVLGEESYQGNYQAKSLILEMPWDRERMGHTFKVSRAWERYADRGIDPQILRQGIEPFFEGAEPSLCFELILSTFPAMVESEMGVSLHETRIIAQRGNRRYKGYIPMNVELLIEYLLAVALSPATRIEGLPVKIWGRYLPDTISCHIRQLYRLPYQDTL
jgi:hypothetical protein